MDLLGKQQLLRRRAGVFQLYLARGTCLPTEGLSLEIECTLIVAGSTFSHARAIQKSRCVWFAILAYKEHICSGSQFYLLLR